MKTVLIAAVGRNGELGKDNHLLFDLPGDLKFFRKMTMGKTVVMGKNTWLSLPGKLPGRKNVVVSRTLQDADVQVISSLDQLQEEEVWCIGGAQLYQAMIPDADELILTEVDADADADVFFPAFDKSRWKREVLAEGEDNGIPYRHVRYYGKRK